MKKTILLFSFGLFFLLGNRASAQSATDSTKTLVAQNVSTKELDTEESFKYMGSELLFQLKKRLHLTTEEEEKQKEKKKEKVAINLFGIKIERE